MGDDNNHYDDDCSGCVANCSVVLLLLHGRWPAHLLRGIPTRCLELRRHTHLSRLRSRWQLRWRHVALALGRSRSLRHWRHCRWHPRAHLRTTTAACNNKIISRQTKVS